MIVKYTVKVAYRINFMKYISDHDSMFEFKVNKSRKKGFLLFDHLSRKYLAVCQLMSSINLCAQVSFITFVMAVF